MGLKQIQELSSIKNINLRKSLTESLRTAITKISVMPVLSRYEQEAGDARVRVESFISQHGGMETKLSEDELNHLRTLKKTQAETKGAVKGLKEKHDALIRERDELKAKLSRIPYYCSLKDFLAYQDALAKTEKSVSTLKDAIKNYDDIITEAKARVPSIAGLSQKREDILSDIAIGKASNEDLEKIDSEISKSEKALSGENDKANKTILKAQQTIAGLTRKLNEAEAELSKIKEYKSELICYFLIGQAED